MLGYITGMLGYITGMPTIFGVHEVDGGFDRTRVTREWSKHAYAAESPRPRIA